MSPCRRPQSTVKQIIPEVPEPMQSILVILSTAHYAYKYLEKYGINGQITYPLNITESRAPLNWALKKKSKL